MEKQDQAADHPENLPKNQQPPIELPSHEALAELARNDPEAYEELRRELIERFISAAPDNIRQRLQGVQFRVDGARRLSRSGLGATLRVYSLMWESLECLNELWQEFAHMNSDGSGKIDADNPPARSAKILDFPPHS